MDLEKLLAERADHVKQAQAIATTVAAAKDAIPSDEQEKNFNEHLARVQAIDVDVARIKSFKLNGDKLAGLAAAVGAVEDAKNDSPAAQASAARSLGEFFVKSGGYEAANSQIGGRFHVAVPGEYGLFKNGQMTPVKAATDAQATAGLTTVEYDNTVTMLPRLQPTVADLLGSGSLTATSLQYWIQVAKEGGPAAVAELGHKPSVHYTWSSRTDTLSKIAGITKVSDESFADIPYIVSEIDGQLLYDLAMVEEAGLLTGDGVGANLEGLLVRSGILALTKLVGDSVADTVFKAMTLVQTTNFYAPDGIVIHPTTYQDLRLAKDANGQYFGGGFFAPAYQGGGNLNWQPPLWGLKTVVTPAVPVDQILVGAFRQAGTVYRKGGVSIDSTNSNVDDFEYNRVTIRAEERLLLQVKRPGAVVKVDLTP